MDLTPRTHRSGVDLIWIIIISFSSFFKFSTIIFFNPLTLTMNWVKLFEILINNIPSCRSDSFNRISTKILHRLTWLMKMRSCLNYIEIPIFFVIDENLFMIVWHRWTWLMKLNTKKNDDGQTYKKKSAKRIFFYTSLYSLSRIFGILRIFFQKMVFFAAAFVPLWGRGSKIFGSRRDLFCQKSWFWDSIFIVFVGYW